MFLNICQFPIFISFIPVIYHSISWFRNWRSPKGINITTLSNGVAIPSDPAATSGSGGGAIGDRAGGSGGSGGSGSYASGGGGGGSGAELNGGTAPDGSGGVGQGGVTIYLITNR